MGTSGYHHAQPSHTPVSHHQYISSPSHCHNWHPLHNEGQGCCHVHGSLSHYHEPHRPPFLPTCHAGVTTPTHPHRKLLPQSPLSSYAQRLPAFPEHQGHCQLEFSSPLGEDGMVLSTKLVPSSFLLAHLTGPSADPQPMEHQHLHSPNAASQVQMLVGSPRVPSMHQVQSQDLPAVGQLNPNASISTLQQTQRQTQPTVSVEVEEDVSVESKSKIALRRSSCLRYFTDTDDSQSEQDVGDKLSAAVRQKKGQVSRKQVDEHCVQQIGDVEVEEPVSDVPAEEEAILEDAILTQPTGTKVPPSGRDSRKTVHPL